MFIDNIVEALRMKGAVNVAPFFYSFQYFNSTVAAGTSVQQQITIQADSDFVAKYMTISVYDSPQNSLVTTLAPLTVSLTDTGSGRNLMDNAQSIQNLMGGAMNANAGSGGSAPFIFPEPLLLRSTSTIQCLITNLTSPTVTTGGRTFQRVDVSLTGHKIFKLRNPAPGEVWYYPVGTY